jgi:hypothetical protein
MIGNVLSELTGGVLAVIIAFIFAGLAVYILMQMGIQSGISLLQDFSNILSNWAITWFPIILIVFSAGIIIVLLVRGIS